MIKKLLFAVCLIPLAPLFAFSAADQEALVLKQLQRINRVPQDQLNEKTDPGFSLLRTLYDQDGPDFLTLRKLLGQGSVRSRLNPSARCVLAGVISQRWDTFTLSGNLYLSGLQSPNAELRAKAGSKLINFIQPAHIPALIDLLKIPGPNVLAFEILQEVTGQHLGPSMKGWQSWWLKGGSKSDIVGVVLKNARSQLETHRVHDFDQERYWYLPDGLDNAQIPYAQRPEKDQAKISTWNAWVNSDVRRYVDDWAATKPILDRVIHQPDPRVNQFLETLTTDAGYGDYASIVLAWRSSAAALPAIQAGYQAKPTVGRALARGSLGDKTALVDLLKIIDHHAGQPFSYKIMDDDARSFLSTLRTVGVVSAEQAYELLCHQNFQFQEAMTAKEKKKAFKKAKAWLSANAPRLSLDRRRGYYIVPNAGR